MQFSQLAWQQNINIYNEIISHPFNQELMSGTLEADKFIYYLQQDYLYLQEYGKVLAKIAAKAEQNALRFLEFAQGVFINEQQGLHQHYLAKENIHPVTMPSTACLGYTSYLHHCCNEDVAIAVAAVVPCFWLYHKLGEHLNKHAQADNPYQLWINTYSSKDFATDVLEVLKIADDYYQKNDGIIRQKMLNTYSNSSQWEYYFWDDAYHQRRFLLKQ